MAELVDAPDSKSGELNPLESSILSRGTTNFKSIKNKPLLHCTFSLRRGICVDLGIMNLKLANLPAGRQVNYTVLDD